MHDHENFERPAIIIPPEQMHRLVDREIRKLVQRRMPFREHISYNENITPFLDALEALNREIPFNGLRWSLEHAETITPENIERVKKLGGGIALDHKMALHGDVFIKSRGLDQALRTTRLLQLVDSVIPLAMSTDAFRAATFNPWVGLSWMVTGRSVSGSEVLAPENRLTGDEALKLFTKGGAWFMNTESEMGLIAPGNLADFAILDRDDFSVPDDQIKVSVVGAHRHGRQGGLRCKGLSRPFAEPSADFACVVARQVFRNVLRREMSSQLPLNC